MPAFASILDKPSNTVERPKPVPQGTYLCTVAGLPRFDKSTKKQTEYVEFTLNYMSAADDVDQEELAAMGGVSGKSIKATYYLTENSLWRLKDFLDHCQAGEEDATLRERIDATPGCQILITIKHTASEDGQAVYANVGTTAQAE